MPRHGSEPENRAVRDVLRRRSTGAKPAQLDELFWRALYAAWLDYALRIFPGQKLSCEQQAAFARRFGAAEFALAPIGNFKADGSPRDVPAQRLANNGFAGAIAGVNLEHIVGQIKIDSINFHVASCAKLLPTLPSRVLA